MSLASEIRTAAQARQADRVLQLCRRGCEQGTPAYGEGWIEAAQAVLELAQRMRLPHGRHGAWAKHRQLLQLVCTLVEAGVEAEGAAGTAAAAEQPRADPVVEALWARARKLLASSDPSPRKKV